MSKYLRLNKISSQIVTGHKPEIIQSLGRNNWRHVTVLRRFYDGTGCNWGEERMIRHQVGICHLEERDLFAAISVLYGYIGLLWHYYYWPIP